MGHTVSRTYGPQNLRKPKRLVDRLTAAVYMPSMTVHAKSHVYTMLLPAQFGVCVLAAYIEQDLEGSVCFATSKSEAASKCGDTAYGMGRKRTEASVKAEPIWLAAILAGCCCAAHSTMNAGTDTVKLGPEDTGSVIYFI